MQILSSDGLPYMPLSEKKHIYRDASGSHTYTVWVGSGLPERTYGVTRIVMIGSINESLQGIDLPHGQALIHLGDRCKGDDHTLVYLDHMMYHMPYKNKITIGGSYSDSRLVDILPEHGISGTSVLNGNFTIIGGSRIYCATRILGDSVGVEIVERPNLIPGYVDILISHVPPYGILDMDMYDFHTGDPKLNSLIERCKPRICAFAGPAEDHGILKKDGTLYINASQFSESEGQNNIKFGLPITIDIE